ncbi:MAG: OsmC family protein [Steroidobacteraceae bacterium]
MNRIASAVVTPTGLNYTQRIATGGFELSADEPLSAGGRNLGPGPYHLLLASLGACTTITLKMYADRKGWNIGALKVALTLSKDSDGGTFIDRTLESDARLDGEQWLKLLDIASKTPVTKTLLSGAKITTRRAEET